MNHTFSENCSNQALVGLIDLAVSIERQNSASQREMINKHSPYSSEVNQAIPS